MVSTPEWGEGCNMIGINDRMISCCNFIKRGIQKLSV